MKSAKLLAAVWWANFFALVWLNLLEVIPRSPGVTGTEIFFFLGAAVITLLIAVREEG